MSSMIEKLWPAFFAEVTEQLDGLELSLVNAEDPQQLDVNQLFRDFHTIKSSCAMMDFVSMEELAHVSEDLLDKARHDELTIDPSIVDLLLRTVDTLKNQLVEAGNKKSNPEPAHELLAELKQRLSTVTGEDVPASDIEVAPAVANAELVDKTAYGRRKTDSSADLDATRAVLDQLSAALTKFLSEALSSSISKAKQKSLASSAKEIIKAARGIGFFAIASIVEHMTEPAALSGKGARERRLKLLADLLSRLHYLESIPGTDFDTTSLSQSAIDALRDSFASTGQDLCAAAAALTKLVHESDLELTSQSKELNSLLSLLIETINMCELMGYRHTVRLLRFTEQVCLDFQRDSTEFTIPVIETLVIGCELPQELAEAEEEEVAYVAMCDQTLDDLQFVAANGTTAESVAKNLEFITSKLMIKDEFLQLLTPRAIEVLCKEIESRRNIFEIEADLESNRAIGEEFVNWVSSNGVVISNRTVFHRESIGGFATEKTKLRFLIAFSSSSAEVKQTLGEIDPSRGFFELHQCTYKDAIDREAADDAAATDVAAGTAATSMQLQETLRVDSEALDKFVTQVGEMVMLRNMMSHILHDEKIVNGIRKVRNTLQGIHRIGAAEHDDVEGINEFLNSISDFHERLTQADMRVQSALGGLQSDVLGIRVVPIALVFNRIPRLVRNLSQSHNKLVHLDVKGDEVRIDKGMIDVLMEPLVHIVRNAIDHGIETADERSKTDKPATARLEMHAQQQGNTLIIRISDDGRGIDINKVRSTAINRGLVGESEASAMEEREIINLIFMPGFSTADAVTETSGRGVGMDVVKTKIIQLGGQIDIRSEPNKGTVFTLKLPLSVAIQGVLLISAGTQQFALPERVVSEIFGVTLDKIRTVQGQPAVILRNKTLPVYELETLLGGNHTAGKLSESAGNAQRELEVVVITNGPNRVGILVDKVQGRQEVFIRDIHKDLASIPGVGGASILGDGQVIVILDCENLFDIATENAQSLKVLQRAS